MPNAQSDYDFISSKISSLKDAYPSLRNKPDDYVFSALGWDENSLMTMDYKEFMAFAKHFFELGMRVSNKEKKGE